MHVLLIIAQSDTSEFEGEGYGLCKELDQLKDLYLGGIRGKVEFDKDAHRIGKGLESLQVSSQPDAARVLPLLKDWPAIWNKMNGIEHRAILQPIFSSLFLTRPEYYVQNRPKPHLTNYLDKISSRKGLLYLACKSPSSSYANHLFSISFGI